MKRVVFAAVIIALLILFNLYCLGVVFEIKSEAVGKLDSLYSSINENDTENLVFECENFTEYWITEHHTLCRIVRHDLLDQATIAVSRFVSLAKYGENGELAAEINRCRILLEEIWDSELPYLRNIF